VLLLTVHHAYGDATVDWDFFGGFSPSQVTISPGEKVTWWNVDPYGFDVTITVTGFAPFTLQPYEGAQATFPNAGNYSMRSDAGDSGTIIVGEMAPPPSVTITNPVNGGQVTANTPFTIGVTASSTVGILYVQIWLEKPDYSWEWLIDDYTEPFGFTTNLAEGNYSVHVYATANDSQSATDSVTFSVVAAPPTPIELANPRMAAGQFLFDVTGLLVGRTNIVSSCTDLSAGTWQPVATNTASSTTATVTNAWSAQPRLYRIQQLP
jgi:hypothetical protein